MFVSLAPTTRALSPSPSTSQSFATGVRWALAAAALAAMVIAALVVLNGFS